MHSGQELPQVVLAPSSIPMKRNDVRLPVSEPVISRQRHEQYDVLGTHVACVLGPTGT